MKRERELPWFIVGIEISLVVWIMRHPFDRWLRQSMDGGTVILIIEFTVGVLLTCALLALTAKLRE